MGDKPMIMRARRVRTDRYRVHEVKTVGQVNEHDNFIEALQIIESDVENEKEEIDNWTRDAARKGALAFG